MDSNRATTQASAFGGSSTRLYGSAYPTHPMSSRLFQIAMQAAVANADAARAEEGRGSEDQTRERPSSYHTQSRSVNLTPEQWQLLTDYHEHELFVRTRSWGFCMAIFAIGIALFGIGSPAWKWVGDMRHPYEIGLWCFCFPHNASCLSILYYLQDDWKVHASIICCLGCACIFGILGLGLAITGACRSALILRLYYYHSAGECLLVSSIADVFALVLYPVTADVCIRSLFSHGVIRLSELGSWPLTDEQLEGVHRYAYAYYLTWISAFFFFSSFVCMNLDLLIQSFVRPIPCISCLASYICVCRRRRNRRNQQRRKSTRIIEPPRITQIAPSPKVTTKSVEQTKQSTAKAVCDNHVPELVISECDEEQSSKADHANSDDDDNDDGEWI